MVRWGSTPFFLYSCLVIVVYCLCPRRGSVHPSLPLRRCVSFLSPRFYVLDVYHAALRRLLCFVGCALRPHALPLVQSASALGAVKGAVNTTQFTIGLLWYLCKLPLSIFGRPALTTRCLASSLLPCRKLEPTHNGAIVTPRSQP